MNTNRAVELGGAQLWLAEDSPLAAKHAERALASCRVRTFTSGEALLEALQFEPRPDGLLLDWELPGISGLELCEFVRARWDSTVLPILILTGLDKSEHLVAALAAGATDYVTKPFSDDVLQARVSSMLRAKTLNERLRETEAELRGRTSAVEAARLEVAEGARTEAEQANRAKDDFLALVSHELRTPLTSILAWTRLLREQRLDAEGTQKGIEIIERSARAQVQLIEDLLDVSRTVYGKLSLDLSRIDFCRLVREATESLRPAVEAKSVTLTFAADQHPVWMAGDAGRLQQVVWNLLSNSLKFTRAPGAIRVALEPEATTVRLVISDEGDGIEPEFLPRVFDRFRQATGRGDRRDGGLGLGLALVRSIVELHGGTVSAVSEGTGRGATFTVELPLSPEVQARL